jgi:ArsR family transcriptional regulator
MDLKRLRQFLKACADDSRLRILNLLLWQELTVKDICLCLKLNQPSVSKHLTRLRLLRIVSDRRDGNLIYYSLNKKANPIVQKLLKEILKSCKEVRIFQEDKSCMNKCLNKRGETKNK